MKSTNIQLAIIALALSLISILTTGCSDANTSQSAAATNQEATLKQPDGVEPEDNFPAENTVEITDQIHDQLIWADTIVNSYINKSSIPQILAAINRGFEVAGVWDQLLITDTAKYIIFHIGHDFEDNFISDGWLYVDTTTHAIYEYDVADQKLRKWSK